MPVVTVTFKPPTLSTSRDWQRVLRRFQQDAGQAVVNAVRGELGTASIYTLTPSYSAQKMRNPRMRRIAGKASDQPLILTGAMMEGIECHKHMDGFAVTEKDTAGMSGGFDYFQYFEDKTDFFGKAFAKVEPSLEPMLMSAIVAEMGL